MEEADARTENGSDSVRRYRRYGVRIEVHGPQAALEAIEPWIPPEPAGFPLGVRDSRADPPVPRVYRIRSSGSSNPVSWSVDVGEHRLRSAVSLSELVHAIAGDAKTWVTSLSIDAVFVHAGVVVRGGRALLIPAATGSGKTTLVRAFLEQGWEYASDDIAVLDSEGGVWPFPLALALRVRDGAREHRSPASFGAPVLRGRAQPGWVLDTRYRAGTTLRLSERSPAQTVLALLQNAPAARLRVRPVLETLTRVAEEARGLAGERGEADIVAREFTAAYT